MDNKIFFHGFLQGCFNLLDAVSKIGFCCWSKKEIKPEITKNNGHRSNIDSLHHDKDMFIWDYDTIKTVGMQEMIPGPAMSLNHNVSNFVCESKVTTKLTANLLKRVWRSTHVVQVKGTFIKLLSIAFVTYFGSIWFMRESGTSVTAELLAGVRALSLADRHHFNLNLSDLLDKSMQHKRNWLLNVIAAGQRHERHQANFDGTQNLSIANSKLIKWMTTGWAS